MDDKAFMRNLLLLLLLANICLGLWIYTQEKAAREAAAPRAPSTTAKPLLLLSELAASEIQNRQAAPTAGPDSEPAAEPAPAPIQGSASVAEELLIAEPLVEPVAPAPLAAEPVEERVASPIVACYTLGPFAEVSKSQRALALLQALGAESSQRTSQEQEPYGYRVYIPPLSSREQAYKIADVLRRAGVKDYFVITNPNDKLNGISLGLFKQRTGAIKRVAQLRNMEYQASIEVRYKDRDIYWLDYSAKEGLVDAPVLLEVGEGVVGMQHLARDCDVSGEKN